ncbi:MAG: hypothetical protein WD407_07725 [Rhodospirillales bacterium]
MKQARIVRDACLIPVLAGSVVLFPTLASTAIMTCSDPLKPICVDMESTYESEIHTNRCKTDMGNYMKKVEEYVSCIKESSQENIDKAREIEKEFKKRLRQPKER